MAIHLRGLPGDCPVSRADGPPISPAWPCSGWGLPSRTGHPARWCALTAPFHPYLCRLRPSAVCSLWHFPSGRPDSLREHPALGAPTFLDALAPRPPSRLTVRSSLQAGGPGTPRERPARRATSVASTPMDEQAPRRGDRDRSGSSMRSSSATSTRRGVERSPDLGLRRNTELSDHRSGHCYLDLVDPTVTGRDSPTLKAKCWRSTWGPLKARLADSGLPRGGFRHPDSRVRRRLRTARELGFIITALDIESFRLAALGEHARRREELLRTLAAEGLLETNKQRAVPVVPLNIGLVASPGTEGYNDFLGMLDNSGFSFRVTLARAAVQGGSSPVEIAGALAALGETDVEVICVVRGGGSQADLAAFDDEVVARGSRRVRSPCSRGSGTRAILGCRSRRGADVPDTHRLR